MSTRRMGPYRIEIEREDKLLYPGPAYSKQDVIDYYDKVADHLLPQIKDRPLMLQRYPDGITEEGFMQKQVPDYFPDWIDRVEVATASGSQTLVMCNNKATLIYLASQACLTLHAWLARCDALNRPDLMIFDLDPPDERFETVRQAARDCHELLQQLQLRSFVKTTGSRGVHITLPLQVDLEFDEVRDVARRVAQVLVDRHPDRYTLEQRINKREGKLYLDIGRNAYGQTAVAPYSLRDQATATVAAPLAWGELQDSQLDAQRYTLANLFRRLGQRPDPWRAFRQSACSLTRAVRRLGRLKACSPGRS